MVYIESFQKNAVQDRKHFFFVSDFHLPCSIHVNGEIEMADILIILGLFSMEHTKVVIRDPTSDLTFVCAIA
jgi:hypothetical protein